MVHQLIKEGGAPVVGLMSLYEEKGTRAPSVYHVRIKRKTVVDHLQIRKRALARNQIS